MKKGLKITLIVLLVLIGIIAIDTIQAKIFNNSPILKIRENLDGGTIDYIDKGLFVNHYKCNNNEKITTWKGTKFACSIKDIEEEFDFYLSKYDNNMNSEKIKEYFTFNDRKIYFTGNIKEFYVVDGETMILKSYISNVNQSLDDSIKNITDKLDAVDMLKDGGTKIYKSKDKDMTIITCKTLDSSKDIYIGDYSMKHESSMCKR